MATSGGAFLISLAIYGAVFAALLLAFSVLAVIKPTRRFYSPRREGSGPPRPRRRPRWRLPLFSWIPDTLRASEADIIAAAGIDAAVYVKFLRIVGLELFAGVTLLALAAALPLNLTAGFLDTLTPQGYASNLGYDPSLVEPYIFWAQNGSAAGNNASAAAGESSLPPPPPLYNHSIPDPPPGIVWWQTLPGLPPLPPPSAVLGPAFERYGWRYDEAVNATTAASRYVFTALDKTTMANVPPSAPRLWAHAALLWAITAVVAWRAWAGCRHALRLRRLHLLTAPPGAESHSVLVTDVPGVLAGTVGERLAGPALRALPRGVRARAAAQAATLRRAPGAAAARLRIGLPVSGDSARAPAGLRRVAAEQTGLDKDSPVASESDILDAVLENPWAAAAAALNTGASVEGMVTATFRGLYDDDVAAVRMVRATAALEAAYAAYEKAAAAAEAAVAAAVARRAAGRPPLPAQRKLVVVARFGRWGLATYGVKPKRVGLFEFHAARLEAAAEAVVAALAAATDDASIQPAAFVTFRTRKAQVEAAGALVSSDLSAWRCRPAPTPSEVLWPSLGLRRWERGARQVALWAAFWLLVATFMIPVTALQALLSTNSLVTAIQDVPVLSSLVTAILPGLALVIFLLALPPALGALAAAAGAPSRSAVDAGVVALYFIFQVVTVFFGSFVAGTVANQFQQLIDDPGSIVTILGTAAPQAAVFFMSLLMTQALVSTPISLLRPLPLAVYLARSATAGTPAARAARHAAARADVAFGTSIPSDTIAALLGITFAVICPLIAPLALLYFAATLLVAKRNFLAVARQRFQGGGMVWRAAFNQLIVGLVIAQVVMVALLGIKKAPGPSLAVAPLPLLTLLFASAAHRNFWPPMRTPSLLTAAQRDAAEGPAGAAAAAAAAADAYLPPSFRFDEEAHHALLQRCEAVRAAEADGDWARLKRPTTSRWRLWKRAAASTLRAMPRRQKYEGQWPGGAAASDEAASLHRLTSFESS